MSLPVVISVISCIIAVLSFVLGRMDKGNEGSEKKIKKGAQQTLIEYRLSQVELKIDEILTFIKGYDSEIDKRVEKAMDQHIKAYHKGG